MTVMGLLRAVVADGVVHPLEKSLMTSIAEKHGISDEEHARMLERVGWTPGEWEGGIRDKVRRLRTDNTRELPEGPRVDPR